MFLIYLVSINGQNLKGRERERRGGKKEAIGKEGGKARRYWHCFIYTWTLYSFTASDAPFPTQAAYDWWRLGKLKSY